jgi:hypothetical protein
MSHLRYGCHPSSDLKQKTTFYKISGITVICKIRMMYLFSLSTSLYPERKLPNIGWEETRVGLRGRSDMFVMRIFPGRAENQTTDLDPEVGYVVHSLAQ